MRFLIDVNAYRHAGVYTAEEVALITREKLIRLQSLYIDQFKRLQHLLKEKKRRYLHSRKLEHDTISEYAFGIYFFNQECYGGFQFLWMSFMSVEKCYITANHNTDTSANTYMY